MGDLSQNPNAIQASGESWRFRTTLPFAGTNSMVGRGRTLHAFNLTHKNPAPSTNPPDQNFQNRKNNLTNSLDIRYLPPREGPSPIGVAGTDPAITRVRHVDSNYEEGCTLRGSRGPRRMARCQAGPENGFWMDGRIHVSVRCDPSLISSVWIAMCRFIIGLEVGL